MDDTEWLNGLKPGDVVVARRFDGHRSHELDLKVQRLTERFIVVLDFDKFRRADGVKVNSRDNYSPWHLVGTRIMVDDAEVRRNLYHTIKEVTSEYLMPKLTTDQLRRIAAILDEGREAT